MSTLAIWCPAVRSRDVRSRVFSRPVNWMVAVHFVQVQMSLQKVDVDVSRTDSEVEREIDNFEQNKLRDIKVCCSRKVTLILSHN